jgi:hypothetical protein
MLYPAPAKTLERADLRPGMPGGSDGEAVFGPQRQE